VNKTNGLDKATHPTKYLIAEKTN